MSGHRTAHGNHSPNAATPTVAGTFTDLLSIIFAPSPACLRNTTSAPLLGGDLIPVGGTMLVVPQHLPSRPQPPLAARRPELSYEDLLGGRVSKLCGYVRTDRHVEALLSTTRVAPAARVEKMMFLLGDIVVSGDNVGKETGDASSSSETKITCFHVLVDEIHGTWRARWPPRKAESIMKGRSRFRTTLRRGFRCGRA